MQTFELMYLRLLREAIDNGDKRNDRTGVGTRALFGRMLCHDWAEGFPLITHRKLNPTPALAEMACFMRGFTDVDSFNEMGCKWWEANLADFNQRRVAEHSAHLIHTDKFADINSKKLKRLQANRDLGPVYGAQWRDYNWEGVDQLRDVINRAKVNPTDRRLLVTAWNPVRTDDMALPPCHVLFQLFIEGDNLDVMVYMRSVDIVLGMPNDVIAYAFLQLAIANELGKKPGRLTFTFGDTHVYENHVQVAQGMLATTKHNRRTAEWRYKDVAGLVAEEFIPANVEVYGYDQGPVYKFDMAV